ncbi:MAG TPA: hypothetical protein QF641_00835 [Candidatus Thalassarchaeaceae archaeon]|nr:hypothetical protein [Candidatus Thalassarchaeaceae archaeon]
MTVPRAALVLSIGTALVLISSSIWVGISAINFLDDLEASFGSTDVEMLESEGRWVWEVALLFDTCSAREDNWEWPESLADQDDMFLFPGELRCDWEHQGEGDAASVAVFNRGNETLNLVMEISGGGAIFSSSGKSNLIINDIGANDSVILEISLTEDVTEREVSITATHVSVLQAQVRLDVNIFQSTEQRDVHVDYNDRIEVDYTLWNADTGEQLDDGTLWVTAGNDPAYIDGFEWSAIGLDIDSDRGAAFPGIDTGTTHTTLLPPPIAYGNSEDHELKDTWLRFQLKVNRAPLSSG